MRESDGKLCFSEKERGNVRRFMCNGSWMKKVIGIIMWK